MLCTLHARIDLLSWWGDLFMMPWTRATLLSLIQPIRTKNKSHSQMAHYEWAFIPLIFSEKTNILLNDSLLTNMRDEWNFRLLQNGSINAPFFRASNFPPPHYGMSHISFGNFFSLQLFNFVLFNNCYFLHRILMLFTTYWLKEMSKNKTNEPTQSFKSCCLHLTCVGDERKLSSFLRLNVPFAN